MGLRCAIYSTSNAQTTRPCRLMQFSGSVQPGLWQDRMIT